MVIFKRTLSKPLTSTRWYDPKLFRGNRGQTGLQAPTHKSTTPKVPEHCRLKLFLFPAEPYKSHTTIDNNWENRFQCHRDLWRILLKLLIFSDFAKSQASCSLCHGKDWAARPALPLGFKWLTNQPLGERVPDTRSKIGIDSFGP